MSMPTSGHEILAAAANEAKDPVSFLPSHKEAMAIITARRKAEIARYAKAAAEVAGETLDDA